MFNSNLSTFIIAFDQWKQLKETYGKDLYFSCNGRLVDDSHIFIENCHIKANLRVFGGKGGFGSMLRALGARIEKTTNHEACRDLNGRRMRDVNNEKNIAEWLKTQDDKEEEKQRKRQEKLERVLNPTHHYQDQEYTSSLQQNAEKINEALNYALLNKKNGSEIKRKSDSKDVDAAQTKRPKVWVGLEDEYDEDLSDDDIATDNLKSNIDPAENNIETNSANIDSTGKGEELKEKDKAMHEQKPNDGELINENKSLCSIESVKTRDTVLNGNSIDFKAPDVDSLNYNIKEDVPNSLTSSVLNEKASPKESVPLNLGLYNSAEHLEEVGLDALKASLMHHGLKCGGTLQERAKRLFLLKDTPIEKLDSNLFAKATKKKKPKNGL